MRTTAPAALGPSSAGLEQAAEDRAQTHDLEVVAVDDAGVDLAGRAEADDGEVHLREGAELLDGLEAVRRCPGFQGRRKSVFVWPRPGALWRM